MVKAKEGGWPPKDKVGASPLKSLNSIKVFPLKYFIHHFMMSRLRKSAHLVRTPPPPVRRHHQIAASGRDP